MSFEDEMEAAIRRIKETHNKIVRTATIDLFSSVIRDTPVDTGRARGNWTTVVGQIYNGEIELDDPEGSIAISEVIRLTPEGAGQLVFLCNSLPYIDRLEYGYSQQAPSGMVRRNVARVQSIVDKAVAQNRG